MWLPVSHSFTSNATYKSILAGKYNNIRVMMGNSGDGNNIASNPWTEVRAGVDEDEGVTNSKGLGNFGAACWYVFRFCPTDPAAARNSRGRGSYTPAEGLGVPRPPAPALAPARPGVRSGLTPTAPSPRQVLRAGLGGLYAQGG